MQRPNTISDTTLSVAICDQYAFYPFRDLVAGGLHSWEDVQQAERFIRTVLLHDYLEMDAEPMPSQDEEHEWTEEEIAAGGRNVITAFLPNLDGYEEVVHLHMGPFQELDIDLPPHMIAVAKEFAGTERSSDPYLKSHLRYLQKLSLVTKRGGSVLAAGGVGHSVMRKSGDMPEALLRNLDHDIRQFAEQANRGELGLVVPPLIAAVIRRASRRDRIVQAVVEMREEWADPRRRIWELLHALRRTTDIKDGLDLIRQLDEISMSIRAPGSTGTGAAGVVWEVTTESGAAAFDAWVNSGNPVLGGALPAAARAVATVGSLGRRLFGLGGFSLARVITREIRDYQPTTEQLREILSADERQQLGL